jgi:multiple sugar transport system substrate-binding protein
MTRPCRRSTWLAALLAACLTVFAACSEDSDETEDGKTQITFSYLWGGAEGEAIEGLISDFNASQDDIVVTGVSSPDFQKQLASMSASKPAFDISDNFGNAVGAWAQKGILAPLDDLYAGAGGSTDDYVPATLDQMRYDDKLYALPIAVHTYQLVYNKTLLDEAGVEPPTTMDELADAIEKLTKTDDNGDIVQLGLGNPDINATLTTLGYANGGSWSDESGPTPTDEAAVAAVQFWQDNVIRRYGADAYAKFKAGWGEYMSPQDPFYAGKTAMVIEGEWQAVNIPKTAPDLDWGVTSIPVASPELAGATQVTTSTLFIPANSQHQEEAATFLKFMTDPEQMTVLTKALGNLPSRTSLLADPAYADIPQFSVWLNSLKSDNLHALPSAPYGAQYSTDLLTAFDKVARDEADAQEALQEVTDLAASYDAG